MGRLITRARTWSCAFIPLLVASCAVAQTGPNDNYAVHAKSDVVGRYCFEESVEVLQLRSAEHWLNAKEVTFVEGGVLFTDAHAGTDGRATDRSCPHYKVFNPGDKFSFTKDEDGTFWMTLERSGSTAPLKPRKATPWPSAGPPVFWSAVQDGSRYYLFMHERLNSTKERVKFYLLAAFKPYCDEDEPPIPVKLLGIEEQCPVDPIRWRQTDVGGGGEKK